MAPEGSFFMSRILYLIGGFGRIDFYLNPIN